MDLQPSLHTICVAVIDVEPIRERFFAVAPFLDERGRRLVAAAEAFAAGYGGIAAVAMATGMAPSTIGRGLTELAQDEPSGRVRRPGAGRQPAIVKDPTLRADLEALVEPTTRGDPESPLRWTCKSVRRLAEALQQQGHQVSRTLAVPWWANCSMRRVTACKATVRPRRATAIPTETRNSPTSTPKWPRRWPISS